MAEVKIQNGVHAFESNLLKAQTGAGEFKRYKLRSNSE